MSSWRHSGSHHNIFAAASNLEVREENPDDRHIKKLTEDLVATKDTLVRHLEHYIDAIQNRTALLENEILTLKREKTALNTFSSHAIVNQLAEICDDLEKVEKTTSGKSAAIIDGIKEQKRQDTQNELKRLKSDYERLGMELSRNGIKTSNVDFNEKYATYDSQRKRNEEHEKDVLKEIFRISKSTEEFSRKFETLKANLAKDAAEIRQLERSISMLYEGGIVEDFNEETRRYSDLSAFAIREIDYRNELLRENNYKSVAIYNIPWRTDGGYGIDRDVQIVKEFLQRNNLSLGSPVVKRLQIADRPIVVTFTRKESVEKLLRLEDEIRKFFGIAGLYVKPFSSPTKSMVDLRYH